MAMHHHLLVAPIELESRKQLVVAACCSSLSQVTVLHHCSSGGQLSSSSRFVTRLQQQPVVTADRLLLKVAAVVGCQHRVEADLVKALGPVSYQCTLVVQMQHVCQVV